MSEGSSGSIAKGSTGRQHRRLLRLLRRPQPWFIGAWLVALGGVVILTVRTLRWSLAWWPLGLTLLLFTAYSLFLLLTYILPHLPEASEWLVDHGVTYLTAMMMIPLIIALAVWWVVNFHWAAEEQLTSRADDLLSTGLTATASYPAVALVQPESDVLTLALAPVATTTFTVTAVITPGSGLTFADAPGLKTDEVEMALAPYLPGRAQLAVVNDESLLNLRRTDGVIAVEFRDANGRLGALTIPVAVEGQRGFALRRFVTSTIDRASPAIFLLLLILPGLATLVQKTIDQRSSVLHTSRKAQFDGLVEEIRKEFRLGAVASLEDAYKAYAQLHQRKYVPFNTGERQALGELLSFAGWDVETGQSLTRLVKGQPPMHVLELDRQWPLEVAGVLPFAYRHFRQHFASTADRHTLEYWQRLMRGAQERSFELRLADHPRLSRELAQLMLDREQIFRLEMRLRPEASEPTTFHFDDLRLRTPFANDSAEHERRFLLEGGAFWGGHDFVMNDLRELATSYAVFGEPGSGRSALSGMLSSGRTSSPNYSPDYVYIGLDSVNTRADVVHALGETVLKYLLLYPSYWRRCIPSEKERIAHLLLSQGRDLVLLQIDRAMRHEQDETLDRLISPEAIQYQQDERRSQLKEIKDFMLAYAPMGGDHKLAGGPKSIAAMLEAASALGFKRVVLVHEPTSAQMGWLKEWFLNNLTLWHSMGLRLCLFPQSDVMHSDFVQSPILQRRELVWNRRQFEKMLKWRYERFYRLSELHQSSRLPHKDVLFERLDPDGAGSVVWELLLKHSQVASGTSYNPGRFMHLWRLSAGDKTLDQRITFEDVEAGASKLEKQP